MPINFKFQETHTKLHVYQFMSGEKTIVDADWIPLVLGWGMSKPNPDSYIFGDEHKEESAVYLGFAWHLSDELDHYVIPNYYRDDAAKKAQLPFDLVNWEYRVEVNDRQTILLDKGFVEARTQVQMGPSAKADWQDKHRHHAGLFHARTLIELARLHEGTLTDASSETSIFCLKPGRGTDLLSFLTSSKRPDLSNFLTAGELFVTIVLGIDQGYWDTILIKTPQDISAKVSLLSSQYERAVAEYEQDSIRFQALEPALDRLYELAQGKDTTKS